MAKTNVIFKARRFTGKDVQLLISDSFIRFLRLTKQHQYVKEVLKGMQRSDVILMNETKKQIQSMKAVWTGFMRNSLFAFIDASDKNLGFVSGKIDSYVATKAWYDILVHEGLGLHSAGGRQPIPPQYAPTMAQQNIAPSWGVAKQAGKKKSGQKGPRPFMSSALVNSSRKIFVELGEGVIKGIRNTVAAASHTPRKDINSVLDSISIGA